MNYFKPNFNSKINEKSSPAKYKIPTPITKIFPSKFNIKIIRNIFDNINYKKNINFNNNISYDHFDTDRTVSSKNSLNGCQSESDPGILIIVSVCWVWST